MRIVTVTIARKIGVILVATVLVGCGDEASQELVQGDAGNGRPVVTVGPPIYLKEVIPPCVPLEGIDEDPCAPGPITMVAAGTSGASYAATPLLLNEPPTVAEIMLGKHGPDTKQFPSLIKHVVIRGTVQVGRTRCHDYYLKLANYRTNKSNEGLIHVHCFVDVRVNEYLVGTGPPELTIGLYLAETSFSDREGYLDREETIAFYGGEDVWIANLLDDPAERTAQAYEGKELVLFLSLPSAITLEALVVNNLFSVWFVQRDEDGTVKAVPRDKRFVRDPEKREAADMPLVDLERKIAVAAANRNAVTGGRIGVDVSLPLLVSDANDLRSHYTEIGAVYVTTETAGQDVEHPTRLPPPVPGGDGARATPDHHGAG